MSTLDGDLKTATVSSILAGDSSMATRVSAVRKLQFCAGHRVLGHESKCAMLHGHNYLVYLHARPKQDLDELGRVIDFSVLKGRFLPWIEENWDHGFILFSQDSEAIELLSKVKGQQLFILDVNPTAENLALHILNIVAPALLEDTAVEIHKVVLCETENCSVEVSL